MKLYKKVTVTKIPSPHGEGGIFKEVDPADLDKMNLNAVRVLGELKKRIAKDADQATATKDINLNSVIATYDAIETIIADLESAANLKVPEIPFACAQDVLVQAGAWKILYSRNSKVKGAVNTPAAEIKRAMDAVLAQARADLALPSSARTTGPAKEKGEEKKCST